MWFGSRRSQGFWVWCRGGLHELSCLGARGYTRTGQCTRCTWQAWGSWTLFVSCHREWPRWRWLHHLWKGFRPYRCFPWFSAALLCSIPRAFSYPPQVWRSNLPSSPLLLFREPRSSRLTLPQLAQEPRWLEPFGPSALSLFARLEAHRESLRTFRNEPLLFFHCTHLLSWKFYRLRQGLGIREE